MTNTLDLRAFLFLLTVSSLVSGSPLFGVEDKNAQTSAVSNYTHRYNNETELQSTSGPPQTTDIGEEPSAAAPTLGQNTSATTHSQSTQGNGTSGKLYNIEGTETNSSQHHLAGNESLAGTGSPPQTPFPEKNGSSDSIATSSPPPFSASVGPRNETNATNSVPIVVTPPHVGTDGPSRSRTAVKPTVPSTTGIRTTQNHTPTKPHSTQKLDKTTAKDCPIAESKKENLVGPCLIAIASLAALVIVFIMTTVILATKLAGSRHRQRTSLFCETEMVCISALMNDSDHPVPTMKRPKSNGALIPITEDEDGDDLTLNSFLHDTECMA